MKNIFKKIIYFVLIVLSINIVFLSTACENNDNKQEQSSEVLGNNNQSNEPKQNTENKKIGGILIDSKVGIKIINIDADVYGESATYTQFLGSGGLNNVVPDFAKRITPSDDLTRGGYKNRQDYENGYLLYAIGLGGYNDGQPGAFPPCSCEQFTNNEFGYSRYIQEVNANNFIATKYGKTNKNIEQDNVSICDNGDYPYINSYTIDKSTKTAQIVYMYTINQWASDGANNAVLGKLAVNQTELLGDNGLDAIKVESNLYIGKLRNYGKNITDWTKMTFNSLGESYFEFKNTYKSEENIDNTYYILLTFTFIFEQSNNNFELLSKTISHNLSLYNEDGRENDKEYNVIAEGCDAVYMASNSKLDEKGNVKIEGELFNPNTSKIKNQVTGAKNQDKLKNNFALDRVVEDDNKTTFLPTGEYGFIYSKE